MKQFSTEFSQHLATGATTLCSCWLIERTDGEVLGFTDHDRTLVFDGVEYSPAGGLEGTEVAAKLGPQVDTSEVQGILHSSAISEQDIELGRYRSATVKSYRVNWADVAMRELLRVDTIGEIVREDGLYRAELRSPQQAMNVPRGRYYQSLCDVRVGDAKCGIDVGHALYSATASVSHVASRFCIEVTGLGGFASDWFTHGRLEWTSGARAKLHDDIQTHSLTDSGVSLCFIEPVGDWVKAEDTFIVRAGCDRRFSTCRDKFSNGVNFQGFPHIPGNDFVLSYPRSQDDFSGSALVS